MSPDPYVLPDASAVRGCDLVGVVSSRSGHDVSLSDTIQAGIVRHAILRCALAIPLVTSLEDIAPRHERQAANKPVTPISKFVGRISLGRCN